MKDEIGTKLVCKCVVKMNVFAYDTNSQNVSGQNCVLKVVERRKFREVMLLEWEFVTKKYRVGV